MTLWEYLILQQAHNDLSPAKKEAQIEANSEQNELEEFESLLETEDYESGNVTVEGLRSITDSLISPDTAFNNFTDIAYYTLHATQTVISSIAFIYTIAKTGDMIMAFVCASVSLISGLSLVPGFKRSSLFLALGVNAIMLLTTQSLAWSYQGLGGFNLMTLVGLGYFAHYVLLLNFNSN